MTYQSGIWKALTEERVNSTRIWFAFVAIGWATYLFSSPAEEVFQSLMQHAPSWVWASLFMTHAVSIIYGVETGRKNWILYALEGWLGSILWVTVAVLFWKFTGGPSPSTVGAMVSVWLLRQYGKFNA